MSVAVSTVTGAIGAITGVVALLVSAKNYSRVSAMKALDLRLELGRTWDNLDLVLAGIEGYLDYVHQSHERVLAATGRLRSGEMQLFSQEFEADKARLRGLLATQPKREVEYGMYTPAELERVIASVHTFQVQVSSIRGKYQKILDTDDERRTELRAAANARAMSQRPPS
jgi:hypothetical protein